MNPPFDAAERFDYARRQSHENHGRPEAKKPDLVARRALLILGLFAAFVGGMVVHAGMDTYTSAEAACSLSEAPIIIRDIGGGRSAFYKSISAPGTLSLQFGDPWLACKRGNPLESPLLGADAHGLVFRVKK